MILMSWLIIPYVINFKIRASPVLLPGIEYQWFQIDTLIYVFTYHIFTRYFLFIPSFFVPDPNMWTVDHVQQWVQWAVREYSLQDVHITRFNMDGKSLCRMSRDDFCRLTNEYNSGVLLSHLNFLKQGKVKGHTK